MGGTTTTMILKLSAFLLTVILEQCQDGTAFIHPTPTSFRLTSRAVGSLTERNEQRHVLHSVTEQPSLEFSLKGKNPEDAPPRLRFAPSPTGSLHVGGARTALYNWLVAKKGQLDFPGTDSGFVLRVEDTDVERSTKESEESVLADLRWLGLLWDEGPENGATKRGPYRQSERSSIYNQLAQRLLDEGKAYRCFCTKEELEDMKLRQESAGEQPRYDGTWRDADPALVQQKLDEGAEYTVRFAVPPGARVVIDDAVRGTVSWDAEATVGDFILLRSSGVPVYNFCVAVDDALMGITTVIRAEEHLTNTLRQGLILDALGAPRPRYAHCSLILGEDKQKLSKRHGATSCNQYRMDGYLPDAMINYLALLGWSEGTEEEIYTRDELIDCFDLNRVNKSPSVFDIEKLNWINSQHLKMLSMDEVIPHVMDQLEQYSVLKDPQSSQNDNFVFAITSLAKQMMITTKDAVTNAIVVMGYNLPSHFNDLNSEAKQMVQKGYFYSIAKELIASYDKGELPLPTTENDAMSAFLDPSQAHNYKPNGAAAPPANTDDSSSFPQAYKSYMKQIAKDLKVKGQNLFHPVRLALTGEMSGQDVTKQLALIQMAPSVVKDDITLISIQERMTHLKSFLDTIPEDYRAPPAAPQEKSSKKETQTKQSQEKDTATSSTTSSSSSDPLASYDGPPITALDIRVGLITNAYNHPEADKLYVEEIDVGDDKPRTITSGLRPYISSADDLIGKKCLVVCNLKARKMLGVESHGMVLCASSQLSEGQEESDRIVKLLHPPVEAQVGERVTVVGVDFEGEEGQPWPENKVGKKKVLEKVSEFFRTSEDTGTAEFGGKVFLTSGGVCTSSVRGGSIS